MLRHPDPINLQRSGYFEGIIDIYVENSRVDLAEANRLGVKAALFRTSVGLVDKHDDCVAYHAAKKKALNLGLHWGAYHVVSPKPADEQIGRFLEIEDGSETDIAMALDWETTSEGTIDAPALRDLVTKFADRTGFFPTLYAGHEVREDPVIKQGDKILGSCPLWYVRHAKFESGRKIPAATWPSFTLWQFDNEDRVNGSPYEVDIVPDTDFNRFKGSEEEFLEAWPFRKPKP